MKHINFLTAFIAVTVVTGCGSSSDEEKTSPASIAAPSNNSTSATPVTSDTATFQTTVNSNTAPVTTNTQATAQTGNEVLQPIPAGLAGKKASTATTQASKAGLNPAHGQPGHRCDISVGAPLDSKPSQPVVNNPNPQVVTPTQQAPATAQPLVTAPGMNPQHGQPGHRCDIAVGAPLNSKPAQ